MPSLTLADTCVHPEHADPAFNDFSAKGQPSDSANQTDYMLLNGGLYPGIYMQPGAGVEAVFTLAQHVCACRRACRSPGALHAWAARNALIGWRPILGAGVWERWRLVNTSVKRYLALQVPQPGAIRARAAAPAALSLLSPCRWY